MGYVLYPERRQEARGLLPYQIIGWYQASPTGSSVPYFWVHEAALVKSIVEFNT